MAYFKVLSQHLPKLEEDHKSLSRVSVTRLRFRQCSSQCYQCTNLVGLY